MTWNNPPSEMPTAPEWVRYMVWQLEKGDNGTQHWQGYVELSRPQRRAAMAKWLTGAHLEPRFATREDARAYCMKTDTRIFGPWEQGSWSAGGQGTRNDLKSVVEDLKKGVTSVDEITLEDPMCYHKYGRTLEKVEDLVMRSKYRTEMPEVIWYHGPTGVGKSHRAFEGYTPQTHYVMRQDNGWWEGYRQQNVVVINEFRGEIRYADLLQMCDKWPYWVRRRGREPMPFISPKIIITSSKSPEECYHNLAESDSLGQLLRRIKVIKLGDDFIERKESYDYLEDNL